MVPQSGRTNFALATNGSVATASSTYNLCCGFTPAATIDGEHKGLNWMSGGGWHSGTNALPHWVQIDFNATRTIDEVDVYTKQDDYANPIEPTEATTFSLFGLTAFDVQYWSGGAWVTVPGGSVSGNNKVWKKITFSAISTTKIRVLINGSVDGWGRIPEIEAWGQATSARTNVALATNGSVATASSTYNLCCGFTPAATIDGEHKGLNWMSGGGWHSGTNALPHWVQIDFNATRTIDEVDVYTKQDDYANPIEPTEATTFSLFGLTAFDVQYWSGGDWVTVPGGSVSGNNKVWKKITFSAISTTKIRVLINGSVDGWGRIPEIEAWSAGSGGGGGSSPSDFAMARLNPRNRTGTGGEDLLSNNFNWNLPLVGLNGRELDLGLTLSYNSLVWTRAGNSINFDLDQGSIAPGFRLGFPTVEGPYFNSQANANFYLLIGPSGARIELRQVGTSIVYESKDSSHIQLTDNTSQDFSLILQTTDGSRLRFEPAGGGWRCKKITDRNGNFISALYKSWGEFETVTDTLGRILTFNYDANSNLQSITQTWGGLTHDWATFGWSTAAIGNNFPGLNNFGPNSTTIAVLTQVGLPDGSRYNFEYNNSYGMVSTIRHFAEDNHQRRYTTYVAPASATDCPRLTERRDWAEYWSNFDTVPLEVVTSFAHDADNGCRMTLPDGTVFKEYYGSSWQSGLANETRSYATVADANSNVWQKKTTTAWAQDNPSVAYLTNPRVTETNVYDASGNRRRTTIDYGASSLGYVDWGLPHIVKHFGGDGTTELRRTQTDYQLTQPYLDRRIIGLVSSNQLYDAVANQWQAKVTYGYDDPAKLTSQATSATQHDASYSQSFTARGNVTAVARWDVTDINNASKALTSTMNYNAAGSGLSATDPAGHTSSISYADSFSDGNNARNTFAYPTTVTDADGFSSTVQYNFDFGAKTQLQGPPPQNQPSGIIHTYLYDDAARLRRVTTLNTGAYTRYVYGPFWTQSFSTVNTIADEAYAITVFNGMGWAFGTATNHPGSTGGYKIVNTIFDSRGRVVQESNPTEIDNSWTAAGDDAYNSATDEGGIRYARRVYNWQGKPLQTIHPDGNYTEASYAGCGCAGGEVVTLTDEMDRKQKVYSDGLGRQWKTEILNWDGSVYSTATNSFNGRDQVTLNRQWAGAENGGGAYQDTTMTFDGYGRLQSIHVPEQNASTATVYAYNPDDTIQSVTDARGADASYTYNSRHLLTGVAYTPSAGVPDTPDASFTYDAAGNRTWATDGVGTMTYHYDQLSRMDWEERTFTGLSGAYRLSYSYNLAGQLTGLAEPSQFGATVSYAYDAVGKLAGVTGTGMQVSSLMTGLQYRASGALKHAEYGDGTNLNLSYNIRQLLTRYELNNVKDGTTWPYPFTTMGSQNQYYADGRVEYTQDLRNGNFDRGYMFDHAGRLEIATSGREARGEPPANTADSPYKQNLSYDPWNNMGRAARFWSEGQSDLPTYSNNRRSDWYYDAEGNALLSSPARTHTYDAAGRQIHSYEESWSGPSANTAHQNTIEQVYDGNGQPVKRVETLRSEVVEVGPVTTDVRTVYFVSSTVLGGAVIAEISQLGEIAGHVYVGGQKLVDYAPGGPATFRHANPANGNWVNVRSNGSGTRTEFDPLGASVGAENPFPLYQSYNDIAGSEWLYNELGNPFDLASGCGRVDGMPVSCSELQNRMDSGTVEAEFPGITINGRNGRVTARQPIRSYGVGLYGVWLPDGSRGNDQQWDFRLFTTQRLPQKPKYPPVNRDEINVVHGGQLFDANVRDDIVNAIVDIANNKNCSNAFEKHGVNIPYNVVKSGKLKVAGTAALYLPNAAGLLGWSSNQVAAAQKQFAKKDRWFRPEYTADLSQPGISTVVFNPRQVREERFGGLKKVVIHAFIHLGGSAGDPSAKPHDLANFPGYDEILRDCY